MIIKKKKKNNQDRKKLKETYWYINNKNQAEFTLINS